MERERVTILNERERESNYHMERERVTILNVCD